MNNMLLTEIDKNSWRLSVILKWLAIFIEGLIIFLGIYAALETDGSSLFSLVKFLLIVTCLCEVVKIFCVEAFAREPSILMAICVIPALIIGLYLTSQNLLHVNSVVQEQDLDEITKERKTMLGLRAKNAQLADDVKEIEINLGNVVEKDSVYKNTVILDSVNEIEQQILSVQNKIASIKNLNNNSEKAISKLNIESYKLRLKELRDQLDDIYQRHTINVDRINSAKIKEMDAKLFGKREASRFFNNQLEILDSDYKAQRTEINKEITSVARKIVFEKDNLKKLSSLNNTNKALVREQESIIKALEIKRSELFDEKESIRINTANTYNQLAIELESKKLEIIDNQVKLLNSEQKIADFKSSHWLFGMVSVLYSQEAMNLSIDDLKKYTYYFVMYTSFCMALLPVFLILISVNIQKALANKEMKKDRRLIKLIHNTYQMLIEITSNLNQLAYNLSTSVVKKAHLLKYKQKIRNDAKQIIQQEKEEKNRKHNFLVAKQNREHELLKAKFAQVKESEKQAEYQIAKLKLDNKEVQKDNIIKDDEISRLNGRRVSIPIRQINSLFSLNPKKQKSSIMSKLVSLFSKERR